MKKSGNNISSQELKSLAQGHAVLAINKLVEILRSRKAGGLQKIKCSELLLGYGFGRPKQQKEEKEETLSKEELLIKLINEVGVSELQKVLESIDNTIEGGKDGNA